MNNKSNKFDYPHPLIKDLQKTKDITQQNYRQLMKQKPPFYETNYIFSQAIRDMISTKLLRLSNAIVVPEQRFGILMQPFNSRQKVERIATSQKEKLNCKCNNCHSFFNYRSQSVSLYEIKCRICHHLQSLTLQLKNTLGNVPSCWDFIPQSSQFQQQCLQKNICFVIEASEFNYNYRVHEIIRSCLNSLKPTKKIIQNNKKFSSACTEDGSSSQDNSEYKQVKYNVAFILFNDRKLFILNQQTCEVLNFSSQFLTGEVRNQKQNIVDFNALFKPLNQMSPGTYEMVEEVLYTSYLRITSCLNFTTKFIKSWVDNFFTKTDNQNGLNQDCRRQVQYKFFINSLKFTKAQPSQSIRVKQVSENDSVASILSNVANTISQKIHFGSSESSSKLRYTSRDQTESTKTLPSSLTLCPNFQFFYLPHPHMPSACQVSQNQVIGKLNNNLYKMYQKARDNTNLNSQLFNQVYYDLFENLTMNEKYFDVKVKIIVSQKVEVLSVGNKALGYNDCSQELRKVNSNAQTGKGFNQYSIIVNSLQSTNTLPIDFKILPCNKLANSKSPIESRNYIQIGLQYKKYQLRDNTPSHKTFQRVFQVQVTSLNLPINFNNHIYSSLSAYVDDETLFYFHLRSIFMECHKSKTNHTILRKLTAKIQEMADHFNDRYGQIDFHKEYVRIFLYSFMITNKPLTNYIDQNFYYSRHLWMKNSMQCIAKDLYPRTYNISKNKQNGKTELKNLKSCQKSFKKDALLLVDNGKNLYFIIGQENSVQNLKNIFGTCSIHQIIQMKELPDLPSNQYYRKIIDQARSYHQSNFLPLKVMELFSAQFDQEIVNLLYIKDDHYRYMRQLWEMQPLSKKMRS